MSRMTGLPTEGRLASEAEAAPATNSDTTAVHARRWGDATMRFLLTKGSPGRYVAAAADLTSAATAPPSLPRGDAPQLVGALPDGHHVQVRSALRTAQDALEVGDRVQERR